MITAKEANTLRLQHAPLEVKVELMNSVSAKIEEAAKNYKSAIWITAEEHHVLHDTLIEKGYKYNAVISSFSLANAQYCYKF